MVPKKLPIVAGSKPGFVKHNRILPGFGLTFGITMIYQSVIAVVAKGVSIDPAIPVSQLGSRRVLAAFRLSIRVSLYGPSLMQF